MNGQTEQTTPQNQTEPNMPDLPASISQPAMTLSKQEQEWRLLERQALALSKATDAIPRQYRNKPADILAVWMKARDLGIPMNNALSVMYVVNGKVTLMGDAMAAIAKGFGYKLIEDVIVDEDASALSDETEWVAKCTVMAPDGEQTQRTFSKHDAIQAGLWGNSEPWKKYPKRMLQMRARAFACRDALPHLLAGIYERSEIIEADYETLD